MVITSLVLTFIKKKNYAIHIKIDMFKMEKEGNGFVFDKKFYSI